MPYNAMPTDALLPPMEGPSGGDGFESRARGITKLLADALSRLSSDQDFARLKIEQAVVMAGGDAPPSRQAGGLAPWQATRATAYIEENLSGAVRIERAAAAVRLSPNYFSRAFKASFGQCFSQYVIGRRIALAQELLRKTDDPLCQVALACGLADQAHLSRMFRNLVGAPPAAWRRHVRGAPDTAASRGASCADQASA